MLTQSCRRHVHAAHPADAAKVFAHQGAHGRSAESVTQDLSLRPANRRSPTSAASPIPRFQL